MIVPAKVRRVRSIEPVSHFTSFGQALEFLRLASFPPAGRAIRRFSLLRSIGGIIFHTTVFYHWLRVVGGNADC